MGKDYKTLSLFFIAVLDLVMYTLAELSIMLEACSVPCSGHSSSQKLYGSILERLNFKNYRKGRASK
jgi:hypothetical protein